MNKIESISMLLAIISVMPSGKEGAWSDAHEQAYLMGLSDIPAADCTLLAKTVQRMYDWRPSVKQILDTYADLKTPSDADTITDVLGSLRELVARYGENGARHPIFPERWPHITTLGAPPELSKMSDAVKKTIRAFGGWVDFARNFDWSNPTDRAQFRDMYKAVTTSASDAALRQLQLDYQSRTRLRLEVGPTEDTPDNSVNTDAGLSRFDAASFMTKLSGKVNAL